MLRTAEESNANNVNIMLPRDSNDPVYELNLSVFKADDRS
jgi:hypothetical protein